MMASGLAEAVTLALGCKGLVATIATQDRRNLVVVELGACLRACLPPRTTTGLCERAWGDCAGLGGHQSFQTGESLVIVDGGTPPEATARAFNGLAGW